ncbi:hypothetical protein [Brevibacillus dissolubilis]|uniref:hypothetical protein n=1 Tax=Brevibacillus dissolubilis TaxID=1844116 RepID=UPI0011175260|nr:hypothetical protein [Brevibacillus dissolubilis]
MNFIKKSFSALVAAASLFTVLVPSAQVSAAPQSTVATDATYSWNLYSSYMDYIPTGARYTYKTCSSVNTAVTNYYGVANSSANLLRNFPVSGKNVRLEYGYCTGYGMTHILARHVPEYFNGSITSTQSLYNPGTSFATLENAMSNTISSNATTVSSSGFTSTGTAVYGYVSGGSVKLIIKGGKVITMYPNGWGLGYDLR